MNHRCHPPCPGYGAGRQRGSPEDCPRQGVPDDDRAHENRAWFSLHHNAALVGRTQRVVPRCASARPEDRGSRPPSRPNFSTYYVLFQSAGAWRTSAGDGNDAKGAVRTPVRSPSAFGLSGSGDELARDEAVQRRRQRYSSAARRRRTGLVQVAVEIPFWRGGCRSHRTSRPHCIAPATALAVDRDGGRRSA